MKLIYGVKPSAVRLDVLTFFGSMIHHIKWLAEPSAEPNKFVTRLTSRMVSMRGHCIAVVVVKNDHAPRAFERQRADKFHQAGKLGRLGARRP